VAAWFALAFGFGENKLREQAQAES